MPRDIPRRRTLRPAIALVATGALLTGAAALLSDRVPAWLGIARNRFDTPGWFPWTLDDTAFHVFIWFGITLLALLAVRTTRARMLVGGVVVLISPVVEYLQIELSATRSFRLSDIIANTQGVALGVLAGLVIGAVADAIEARYDLAPHRKPPGRSMP